MNIYNGIKLYFKKNLTTKQWDKLQKINNKCRNTLLHINEFIYNYIQSIYLYIKYNNYVPNNKLSIVAIIKNEGPYIAEWIEYHLLVGVTKFYIYDNESEDNTIDVLEPYIKTGIVEYKYCPGRKMQIWAYNDVLKKARDETYWLAVIDCDEFIVPISTESIPALLKEYETVCGFMGGGGVIYGGIGVNWMVYGSGGQQNKKNGLVIERFKDHSKENIDCNRHIKTIINPRYVLSINVHDAVYARGKFCVNTNKDIIIGPFSNGIFDKIRINHYFSKSYEEFLKKRERGMATHNDEIRPIKDFFDLDRNEEKDDPIMNKYIPVIYKNIEERYKNCAPTNRVVEQVHSLFYSEL